MIIVYSSNIESISNSNGKSKIFVKRNTCSYNSSSGGIAIYSNTYDRRIICSFIDNSLYNVNSSSIYRSIFSSNNIDGKVCM